MPDTRTMNVNKNAKKFESKQKASYINQSIAEINQAIRILAETVTIYNDAYKRVSFITNSGRK